MSSVNCSGSGIPRIIHQIWIQGASVLPPRYRDTVGSWVRCNPGWTHRLWDEDALHTLLLHEEWWSVYLAQPEIIARADVARYAVLQRFGGVYADVDTECRRPIEPLFSNGRARVYASLYSHPRRPPGRYTDATNSFLASTPGHSLWDSVRAEVRSHDPARIIVTARSGPGMLSRLLEQQDARMPGDVGLLRFPTAFTSALVPVSLMRMFSRLHPHNRVLDFNDGGRAGVREFFRKAWRR